MRHLTQLRMSRRLVAMAALVAIGAGCATDRLWAPSREQVIQRILPSSVQVVVEEQGRRFRSGSGVVIAARPLGDHAECLVLTAGHTLHGVTDSQRLFVLLDRHRGKGSRAPATVVAQHEADDMDLALLRVETDRCVAARFGLSPTLGDAIWVVAFPWGRNMTLAGGNVSQLDGSTPEDGESPRLMVDASVSYGASGGGVFQAATGRLVGLVEGYRTARVSFKGEAAARFIDVPVPGETYVTSLASIRRFLTDAGYATLLP